MVQKVEFHAPIISSGRITIPNTQYELLDSEKGDIVKVQVEMVDDEN